MTAKKLSDGIFDAAPAVLLIACSAGTVINGISYLLHRDVVSKILFTVSTLGMVTATVIHKTDKLFNNVVKPKDDCIDVDTSKDV